MPAILEDLYVDWISKEIEKYFNKIGFRVGYTAVSQPVEKTFPFDRLYGISSDLSILPEIGLFALQFKAPDRLANDKLKFEIDLLQLQQLQRAEFINWIFYAFPYFTNPIFQFNALHLVNFVKPFSMANLKEIGLNSIYWYLPYFFIEFGEIGEDVLKKLEMYKAFTDDFYSRGEGSEWVLTRKSCVFSDGKHRHEIPHFSWGELFGGLIMGKIGKYFRDKEDFEKFLSILHDIAYRPSNAILIALNSIRKMVRIIAIFSGKEEFTNLEREEEPF